MRLLLIDGFNLLSRGYFATSFGKNEADLPRNSSGLYTNALRVFFSKIFKLIKDYEATHFGVAWDIKREDSVRRMKYDFYKASRNELPDALIQQYETCVQTLDKLGMKQLTLAPYEADDLLGAISLKWSKDMNTPCYIYSNDKDLFQLLDHNVSQIIGKKGQDTLFSAQHFQDEFQITPKQWVDVKALLGDKSDNIPGCTGIGEKSALPLIQQYGSIDELFVSLETLDKKFNRYKKKLAEGKDHTFVSKELSEIICDIPEINDIHFDDFLVTLDHELVLKELETLELRVKV